jgi:hypothetical protein
MPGPIAAAADESEAPVSDFAHAATNATATTKENTLRMMRKGKG